MCCITFEKGGTNHQLDKHSWSNFMGSTISGFYNTNLSHFRRKFDNPMLDIIFGAMSKINIQKILGFANGGEIPTNSPILVGENGPELFMSKAAGNIIPNHQIFSERKRSDIVPINLNFNINVSKESEISS